MEQNKNSWQTWLLGAFTVIVGTVLYYVVSTVIALDKEVTKLQLKQELHEEWLKDRCRKEN